MREPGRYHIYAAPEYLRKHGVPETADELDRHALIVYGESATPPVARGNWLLRNGPATRAETQGGAQGQQRLWDIPRRPERARDRRVA